MRVEVAGANVTDAVVEVLDTLQNHQDITELYVDTLDELTRSVILDIDTADEEVDTRTLGRIRVLQMIRRDILALSSPPDVDDPANDTPAATL